MIDQKAREIHDRQCMEDGIRPDWDSYAPHQKEPYLEQARWLLEGRRQAFEEAAAFLVQLCLHDEATAIRALIERTNSSD